MAQTSSARRPSQGQFPDLQETGDHSTPVGRQSFSPDQVHDALRTLPSHGWTSGWTGRRDRALLVLSQLAGLSYENIADLKVADIHISDGTARISTPGGTTILRKSDDDLICGPCALARWIHALDLAALYPNTSVIAAVIARAAPLTADSPHLCQGTIAATETTRLLTLLPSSAQWGPYLSPATPSANPTPLRPGQRVVGTGAPAGRTAGGRSPAAYSSAGYSSPVVSAPMHSGTGRSNGGRAVATDSQSSTPVDGSVAAGSSPVVRIPAQRARTPGSVTIGAIPAIRSRYTDQEQSVAQSERLARGLEGRTRQLLDRSDD